MVECLPGCCEAPASVSSTLKTNLNHRRPLSMFTTEGLVLRLAGLPLVILCGEECSNLVWACSSRPVCSSMERMFFHQTARSIASATRHFEAGFGRVSPAGPWKHREGDWGPFLAVALGPVCWEFPPHDQTVLGCQWSTRSPQEIALEAESIVFSIILGELVQLVCTTTSSVWFLACHLWLTHDSSWILLVRLQLFKHNTLKNGTPFFLFSFSLMRI